MFLSGWLSACGRGGGASAPTTTTAATTYDNYNKSVASVTTSAQTFLQVAQDWEGNDFSGMSVIEIKVLAKSFIDSGNSFVSTLNNVNATAGAIKKQAGKAVAAGGLPSGASVSPTLPIAVGGVIDETATAVAALNSKYDAGQIDDNTYKTEMDKIRKAKTLKAAGIGVSTIVGIAGGAVVGAGLTLAAAPGAVVIGGTVLAGAAVGKTISWIWNSCSGTNKAALAVTAVNSCKISAGQTTPDASIPNLTEDGGTMIISIPGYVPVVITNFKPPQSGNKLNIDFTPVPVDANDPGATITVDYNEIKVTASLCSQILSITGLPSPLDPGPGQSVTVTATVFPAIAGCNISFSITGTDGYSKSATPITDALGRASFSIPGGAADVHDTVSMGSNEKTHVVTYTF